MNLQIYAKVDPQHRSRTWIRRSFLSVILLFIMMALGSRTTLANGPTGLVVREYERNGEGDLLTDLPGDSPHLIPEFDFLINEDNAGDPNAIDAHDWPSTALESHSPVVATGDETTDFAALVSGLPDGRYLITVRAKPMEVEINGATVILTHQLGGAHFAKNYTNTLGTWDDTGDLVVELVREPLFLSTIRAHVFEDNSSVNGEQDIPIEQGLAGFHIVIEDPAGEVTVDWNGDPLCGGYCVTDINGDVIIENLPRGKYEVLAIPPDGSGWIQTSTIEGTPVIDAFIQEGNPGYAPSEFQLPITSFGFVKGMNWGDPGSLPPGTGQIRGTIKTAVEWLPPVSDPAPLGEPVERPWIALNDIGGNDNQVYTARGEVDGSFVIDDVPEGLYQMTIWDGPQDYIISFATVSIPNDVCLGFGENSATAVDMNWVPNPADDPAIVGDECIPRGGHGIPRWYGWLDGTVVLENHPEAPVNPGNGRFDPGEVPLSGVELLMRFRDGSIRYSTVTDNDGYYEFPEVFQLGRFYITEVGFGLLGTSGGYLHDRWVEWEDANNDGEPDIPLVDLNSNDSSAPFAGALTIANLNWAGKRETVDWGKYNYPPGENGGISGIVQYATTRNEFEARIQATEDYEPGIPGVTVNLYELNPSFDPTALPTEPNSDPRGGLLNTTETDAWTQPTDCDMTDKDGNSLTDLNLDPTLPLPLGPTCIEAPNLSNEIKEGVFDGGYAFEERYVTPGDDTSGLTSLLPGDYVVEVVPPPGYKIVTEEDLNTIEGNQLVAPAIPPADCVGDLYHPQVPDDYDSPFDAFNDDGTPKPGGTDLYMPKCNLKSATLQEGQNKGVDFYLMTDNAVPTAGRIFGVLLDDLNVETDPTKIYYGEKKGIAHTSVAVRDHTGRLITMLETDDHGLYEVLLPSTFVADCPIPSGVCPAMYQLVGNDPGDPGAPSPHYNPNYQSRYFWFDVWPGKTTFADIALFPIAAQQADCTLSLSTPQLHYVSTPYGKSADIIGTPAGATIPNPANGIVYDSSFTITGEGFGATTGNVTLGGAPLTVTSWSPTSIDVTIPAGFDTGPGQLLVEVDLNGDGVSDFENGEVSRTGLTFHVIGDGYTPHIVTVDDDGPANHSTIGSALTTGSPTEHRLVVVKPGTYIDRFDFNRNYILQGYGPGSDHQGTGGSVIDLRFNLGQLGPSVFDVSGDGPPFNPTIDGFLITGSRDDELVSGAIKVDMGVDSLQVSNNIIRSNGGGFGGGVTVGEPYRGDNDNDNIHIHHNRFLYNGGIRLAGAIGIYNGADNYEIDHNDICGNYSAEYGGGISHHGLSNNGHIHHNRIYFNGAFDEGGGVIIAGELPAVLGTLTQGSGNVTIDHNLIQGNMSNDDGGGIRTLQPLDYSIDINNNMVINNVATDLGGGISLDDTSRAAIVNNTVARNATTATAEDSDGLAHGAGITSEPYSPLFSAYLGESPGGYPDPVMFNNIICENQAYTYDTAAMTLIFDSIIDLEVLNSGPLQPTYSLLTDPTGYDATNIACLSPGDEPTDPTSPPGTPDSLASLFVEPYHDELGAITFRAEPDFVTIYNVTTLAFPDQLGDYHLAGPSTKAVDAGIDIDPTGTPGVLAYPDPVHAPCNDYDDDGRPYDLGDPDGDGYTHDIGADEIPVDGASPGPCVEPAPGPGLSLASNQTPPVEATAGSQITLFYTLKNTGGVIDTYALMATVGTVTPTTAAGDWLGAANVTSVTPVTLDPGPGSTSEEIVEVTVNIPAVAGVGTMADINVTATSQTAPNPTRATLDTITVIDVPVVPVPAADIYMTFDQNTGFALSGITDLVGWEDIVGWNGTEYVMVFDGSDLGITGVNWDAFDILDNGSILLSTQGDTALPDVGPVSGRDIVLFTPTLLGPDTAGTFSGFLDGSAVGLTTGGEDVDAINLIAPDELLISTVGLSRVDPETNAPISGANCNNGNLVCGDDEDMLLFRMDGTDPNAGGFWSLYFDGSDVGFDQNSEDVDSLYVVVDGNGDLNIHLSTMDNFDVGLTGTGNDIFVCQAVETVPDPTGEPAGTNGDNTTTSCTNFDFFYLPDGTTPFIGANFGIDSTHGQNINGIDIP